MGHTCKPAHLPGLLPGRLGDTQHTSSNGKKIVISEVPKANRILRSLNAVPEQEGIFEAGSTVQSWLWFQWHFDTATCAYPAELAGKIYPAQTSTRNLLTHSMIFYWQCSKTLKTFSEWKSKYPHRRKPVETVEKKLYMGCFLVYWWL